MKIVFEEIVGIARKWESLGTRVLDNGTCLIGHVPHVAPLAYLNILFPPLTELKIAEIEGELNVKLPQPLREFYLLANGAHFFSGSLSIFGYRENYRRTGDAAWQPFNLRDVNLDERPSDAMDHHFFFGFYDWDGSLLYLDGQTVIRCKRHSVSPLNTWSSLEEMLLKEMLRISNLFDENGRELDRATPTIPSQSN